MMNVLITAGGTSEPIDSVRSISNTGTGKLGSLIADEFVLQDNENVRVFYICSHSAFRPQSKNVSCIEIGNVSELQTAVTDLMKRHSVDAVIHSMAVSDYRVRSVTTTQRLTEYLQNRDVHSTYDETDIYNALTESDIREKTGKISSQFGSPLILLEQTPKILPMFRQMLPDAVIVGFKLLSQVSQKELIDTAYGLLVKNGCNLVLANDSSQITGDQHKGYLIDTNKNVQTFGTKQEIAKGIVEAIMKRG